MSHPETKHERALIAFFCVVFFTLLLAGYIHSNKPSPAHRNPKPAAASQEAAKPAAPVSGQAPTWHLGTLNVRVFSDPVTHCQYLVFQTATFGSVAVTPREGMQEKDCGR